MFHVREREIMVDIETVTGVGVPEIEPRDEKTRSVLELLQEAKLIDRREQKDEEEWEELLKSIEETDKKRWIYNIEQNRLIKEKLDKIKLEEQKNKNKTLENSPKEIHVSSNPKSKWEVLLSLLLGGAIVLLTAKPRKKKKKKRSIFR
jgi:hypothetical protein